MVSSNAFSISSLNQLSVNASVLDVVVQFCSHLNGMIFMGINMEEEIEVVQTGNGA